MVTQYTVQLLPIPTTAVLITNLTKLKYYNRYEGEITLRYPTCVLLVIELLLRRSLFGYSFDHLLELQNCGGLFGV